MKPEDGPTAAQGLANTSEFLAAQSAGLFVGVSKFEDPSLHPIQHGVDDAIDLAHLFACELCLVQPDCCLLALSGDPVKPDSQERLAKLLEAGAERVAATFTNLYRHLDRQCQKADKQGLLIVTFATHGISDEGKPVIGAADTIKKRPIRTSMQVTDLIDTVSRSQCPRRLVLIDACRLRLSHGSRDLAPESSGLAAALAGANGMAVLSAAAEGGKAFEDPALGNGVFTAALIEGLRGQAEADAQGFITARSLSDYVSRWVQRWVEVNRPEIAKDFIGITCNLDSGGLSLPLALSSAAAPSASSAPATISSPAATQAGSGRRAKSPDRAATRRPRATGPSTIDRLTVVAASVGIILAVFVWTQVSPNGRGGNVDIFQILSSSWGFGSLAAFAAGIFLAITMAVIKKSRPGAFDGQQTLQFFRFAMALAFLFAVAALAVAALRGPGSAAGGLTPDEKIKQLALQLKSEDISLRRQAREALVRYGGSAADELVLVIREEAGATAVELIDQTTGDVWSALFGAMLGNEPWKTPFLTAAAATLAQIGEPAVPAILEGLALDSAEAENLMQEQARLAEQAQQAQQASPKDQDLLKSFKLFGSTLGVAGAGMRISISREALVAALRQMEPLPIPQLLDGLESPRILVQMSCYQILAAVPEARGQTIQRLKIVAQKSASAKERDQILATIHNLEGQG